MKKKIIPPTQEEILKYSSPSIYDEHIASQLVLWEKISDPKTKFYLVMEKEKNIMTLCMEDAEEVYLDCKVRAYLSQSEALKYIHDLVSLYEKSLDIYHVWTASINAICDTIPSIIEDGEAIRIELHRFVGSSSVAIDVLWDNTTT